LRKGGLSIGGEIEDWRWRCKDREKERRQKKPAEDWIIRNWRHQGPKKKRQESRGVGWKRWKKKRKIAISLGKSVRD